MENEVMKLCETFTEATGFLCSAGEDNNGQIIIYTGLSETADGRLRDMETEEVQPLR